MNDIDIKLYDTIFKRKSFHLFLNVGNEKISDCELALIERAFKGFTPLFPDVKTAIRIVPESETSCRRGAQYCILLYSEKKDGYLQNIGYLGEQLDLYLPSLNIGALWFGLGRTKEKSFDGLEYTIMIAIRKIDDDTKFRKDMLKSKRKPVEEIWEGETIGGVTDVVRFAPSACNSQPWKVVNDGNDLFVYRRQKPGKVGIMPANLVSYFNRMDMGIFLCFMDLCLKRNGKEYIREAFCDSGECLDATLNAVYRSKR